MARLRDYAAEYRRRLARANRLAKERGLIFSKSQARGHPRKGEPKLSAVVQNKLPQPTVELEQGLKYLRQGQNLRASAKSAGVSEKRLRHFIKSRNLAERKGQKWQVHDRRARRVLIHSQSELRNIIVPGVKEAERVGDAWNRQGQFVRTNDISVLAPLEGKGVKDIYGKFHPFETNPNTLHRLAAVNEEAFHEIYEIQT